MEYEYNAANQLSQVGARNYQYDQNGNLIKEELYGHHVDYSYNQENRLVKVVNESHPYLLGGSKPFLGEVNYSYDALNRKVERVVQTKYSKGYRNYFNPNNNKAEVSNYIYDGTGVNVLAEYQLDEYDWQPREREVDMGMVIALVTAIIMVEIM